MKYTREQVTDGYIGVKSQFPVTPRRIEVKLSSDNSIKLSNGLKTISITNAAIKADDLVVFDFINEQVLVNGADWTSTIDLESDFENFIIDEGQTITTTNGEMKIFYRGATI